MDKINQWAVWTCVIFQQALGFGWYSDRLFKSAWAAGLGKSPADIHMGVVPLIMSVTVSLIMTRMLGWLFLKLQFRSVGQTVLLSAMVWAAFSGPLLASHYLFMGLPNEVIWIDAGKELVAFLVTGWFMGKWGIRPIKS